MRLSRRNFVKSASALSAVAASPLFLTARAQAAVEPTTAIAIASAAFSIYRMSQSGGGGIAALLSAQVQMLKAISAEVQVINQKLDIVYDKLEDIEAALDRVPQAVTDALFRKQVLGSLYRASQLLELAQTYESRRGRLFAIEKVSAEAGQVLESLSAPLSSIIVERNPANLPIVTMAWFVELQLRARALPYDRERIRKAAQGNLVEVDRMLPTLQLKLDSISSKASELQRQMIREEVYKNYGCYDQIVDEARIVGGGGAGGWRFRQAGRWNQLSAKIEEIPNDPYVSGFTDLALAGLELPAFLRESALEWNIDQQNRTLVDRFSGPGSGSPSDVEGARRALYDNTCNGPLGAASAAFTRNRKSNEEFRKLKLDALVNGHLLLVGRELQNSARGILSKLPDVTDE